MPRKIRFVFRLAIDVSRFDIVVGKFVRYRPNGLLVGSTDGFQVEMMMVGLWLQISMDH